MAGGKRRIDRILGEGYLAGLPARSIEDIRTMRAEVSEEEALVSYERRLLHGRLAILRAELDRRHGVGDRSILDRLPEILGGEQRGTRGAFPTKGPRLEFEHPQRKVSKLVSDDTLANLSSLDEAEIDRILSELVDAEQGVSEIRRPLLDVLNALNEELARRYRSGEADPSDVLTRGR